MTRARIPAALSVLIAMTLLLILVATPQPWLVAPFPYALVEWLVPR
jgi:hypothetical protein